MVGPDPDWQEIRARSRKLFEDAAGADVRDAGFAELAMVMQAIANERAPDVARELILLHRLLPAASPDAWRAVGEHSRQVQMLWVASRWFMAMQGGVEKTLRQTCGPLL